MKKLIYVVFCFVYELILSFKRKVNPDLQHVIADMIWEDYALTEKDIKYIYDKISKAFCHKYRIKKAPKLVFRQIDPNDIFMGLFEYKPYTISININSLIKNTDNSSSFMIVNTIIFVLLHELRHCWQYKYHKEDILYWCETHNHLYNIFYEECPIEIDANEFAKSAGLHDSGDIFNKLPLSLYEDFDKAVGLKEEAEASRKIKKAVAVALNRIYLE